jgi:hypothetical protein
MTMQDLDKIIIKGVRYSLWTFPLDTYWTMWNPKPKIRLLRTSCWRGYIATWEITDDVLYLIDIIFNTLEEDVGLPYLFPNNAGRIKATWYTGELRVPFGERLKLDYDEPGFESDLFLKVKKGKVLSHRYKAYY